MVNQRIMYEPAMPKRRSPRLGQSSLLKQAALLVRLTDEQLRCLQRSAAEQGLSTSTWARMILLRETKGEKDEPRE
jgi:predicted DNA binding CopG/RHH family protein